ncbi:HSP20-like chaperone [Hypomontagnella submonticulosa]|nr:HSP20-like chaperone [Hypomontagnella submonticulosa]
MDREFDNTQAPWWEYMRSFGPNGSARPGVGVDHANSVPQFPQGFPFDGTQFDPWRNHGSQGWGRWAGPWAHQGWYGRDGRDGFQRYRDVPESDKEEEKKDTETESSPETMRPTPDESVNNDGPHPPPPPGAFPNHPPPPSGAFPHPPPFPPRFHHGHPHPFGPHRGRGRCGRGNRRGQPQAPPAYNGPWDFKPLMHAFATHPFAQAFKDYVDQARAGTSGEANEQHDDDTFTPPVDIFNTEKAFVLHVSLPGAMKEDIGVNWDGEKLNIAGVVYRPGNEEFLQTMTSSERKVGMFENSIKLPPVGSGEKDDVDGLGITAKMENGILIVTVPKTEKEWTEVHKVDIE